MRTVIFCFIHLLFPPLFLRYAGSHTKKQKVQKVVVEPLFLGSFVEKDPHKYCVAFEYCAIIGQYS